MSNVTIDRTLRRKRRIRAGIKGTRTMPRMSVHRSNRYIYIQAIDDEARKTLVSFSSLQTTKKNKTAIVKKTQMAKEVGQAMAKLLLEKQIKTCVFDRSSYAYKGRVKALAEGLREGGIKV